MVRFTALSVALVGAALAIRAGDIEGTITIERKLTHRKVTLPMGTYERGIVVSGNEESMDPLEFERTHVVIYLEGSGIDAPAARAEAVMEQRKKTFVPDLLAIAAGSSVSFPNLDPIFHNVFSLSKTKEFDLGNYPKGSTRVVVFPKPGIVFVNCHLHPNMTAAIVICPNPVFTKADVHGKFRLTGVPPGLRTIVAWHKAAGLFRQEVSVSADSATSVEFKIPLPAER